MMTSDKIMSHPSIVHVSELIEICKPLDKLHKIDYFAHVNVDSEGNFSALGKNPEFVEHYFRAQYYNHDIHVCQSGLNIDYVIQDNVQHFGETDKLFKDCEDFKLHHIFTIVHRNSSSIDAYHFATSQKNHTINEFYLRALPILKQFISYFKECTHKNKHFQKAYERKFTIDKQLALYDSSSQSIQSDAHIREMIHQIDSNRHQLFDVHNNYLTKRELECIIWLHFGKSAEEIAIILNITERTVRAHISSIKEKLNCQTMFQLGEKISETKILELIDFIGK